ncbi:MAG TPA: amidohydrolase family protein [Chloroflexota bacterium]|nr:amidohydrolase family protein [Chloroflexota bacterium]
MVERWPDAAPDDVPVWDCHGHLHDDPGGPRGARLLDAMDHLGIERILVSRLWGDNRVPATATPDDFRRANRAVEGWTARHRDRFLPYCFVSCTYPEEAERELEECVERRGFLGLKLYAACRYDDPRVEPVVARAARYGIPTLLHVVQRRVQEIPGQYVSDGREVAHLARRLPDAALIMAHVGGGGDWAYSLKAVRPHANVYVDLAGSVVDAGLVERAYAAVGPGRLLFGTDGSMCEGTGKLRGADIPDADKRPIWGETLRGLLERRERRRA